MNQRKIQENIEVADMEKRRPRERGQKWGGTDGETRRILESENKKGGTMKKLSFVAMLLLGATILGATVFSEPIVRAAQAVEAKIVGPLDGQGNVKVVVRDPEVGHEPWHVILGRDEQERDWSSSTPTASRSCKLASSRAGSWTRLRRAVARDISSSARACQAVRTATS
jgi:hypothetical protein